MKSGRRNLVGRVFGRLKVLRYAHTDKNQKAIWLCQCTCGVQKEVPGYHMLRGDTKSCGCLKREAAATLGQRTVVRLRKTKSKYDD